MDSWKIKIDNIFLRKNESKKKKKTHRSFAMQKENAGNIDFSINQKEKAEKNKNRIKKFLFVFLLIYYNCT